MVQLRPSTRTNLLQNALNQAITQVITLLAQPWSSGAQAEMDPSRHKDTAARQVRPTLPPTPTAP